MRWKNYFAPLFVLVASSAAVADTALPSCPVSPQVVGRLDTVTLEQFVAANSKAARLSDDVDANVYFPNCVYKVGTVSLTGGFPNVQSYLALSGSLYWPDNINFNPTGFAFVKSSVPSTGASAGVATRPQSAPFRAP